MEWVAFQSDWIFILSILLLFSSLWAIKKISRNFVFSIIPVVLTISSLMMIYLIDLAAGKHIFVILSSIIYYLSLMSIYRLKSYSKDHTARGMVAASATTALFFFYTAAYGIYLNFSIQLSFLMFSYFFATILVSYEYFFILKQERKMVLIYSIILGMIMAEIAWVINFWPFGYLTTGVITLIFYYVFWDLTQSYFLNILSKKRLVANLVFFSVIIGLILVTSDWLPVV